jgi:hypothetical protein
MSDAEKKRKTSISKAGNIKEISEFWDTHSLADHWDETREASFEIRATHRRRVTIDPDLYSQLATAAQTRGVSPETLVNLWLAEHLKKGRRAKPSHQSRQQ